MIKINLDYSSVKIKELKQFENKINQIVNKFKTKDLEEGNFVGWYKYPINIDSLLLERIENDAMKIRNSCNTFVVCGIGGSYLGARCVIEAIKGFGNEDIEIVYLGNTFDERYTDDILNNLRNREFFVNVISKSGSTLETSYAFRKLKELLIDKYGDNYKDKIISTTDEKEGTLRKMTEEEGYSSYVIPKNIGGRYSVFTPVGLLPLAVKAVNLKEFINGAKKAFENLKKDTIEDNISYQYAAYRYLQYLEGKKIEMFATYSPYLNMVSEWWKQLFGESEGKDGKGLFPASVNFSTDLHSMGQYIQQGTKMLFITQLKINSVGKLKINCSEKDTDNLNYLCDMTLNDISAKAQEGTNKAHYEIGGVDNFTFELDCVNEFNLGYLLYTFMYSCMISANLIGVNPFDQPGVEFYKQEMKKLLKK